MGFQHPQQAAHKAAGHAAAAKSKNTPPHLKQHQEKLAMGKSVLQGNVLRGQTAPLGNPGSSLQQPAVSTPMNMTPTPKVRVYAKPVGRIRPNGGSAKVPKIGKGGIAAFGLAPQTPKQPGGRVTPNRGFTHAPGNKVDFGAPKNPRPLGTSKKMAAIYGG